MFRVATKCALLQDNFNRLQPYKTLTICSISVTFSSIENDQRQYLFVVPYLINSKHGGRNSHKIYSVEFFSESQEEPVYEFVAVFEYNVHSRMSK